MSPLQALFRLYRPMMIWFGGALLTTEVIAVSAIMSLSGPLRFSYWLAMAGVVAKYWPLVLGGMLVMINLRQFLTSGVTRREFILAAAVIGVLVSAGIGCLVAVGHGVESAVLGLVDQRAANYPVLPLGEVLGEVGQVLPVSLAYLTTGALIAAGFHRFHPWVGVALIVPGAVPAAIADGLLGIDEFGVVTDRLPYWAALIASVLAIAAAAAAFHRITRDIAIRPATG
jgi:hypothetical protein